MPIFNSRSGVTVVKPNIKCVLVYSTCENSVFTSGSPCTLTIEPTDCTLCYLTYYWIYDYSRSNSIKSPASDAGKTNGPGLMSPVRVVYEVVCAQISALLQSECRRCQYSSADVSRYYHVRKVRGMLRVLILAVKIVKQNDWDFVEVILL